MHKEMNHFEINKTHFHKKGLDLNKTQETVGFGEIWKLSWNRSRSRSTQIQKQDFGRDWRPFTQ